MGLATEDPTWGECGWLATEASTTARVWGTGHRGPYLREGVGGWPRRPLLWEGVGAGHGGLRLGSTWGASNDGPYPVLLSAGRSHRPTQSSPGCPHGRECGGPGTMPSWSSCLTTEWSAKSVYREPCPGSHTPGAETSGMVPGESGRSVVSPPPCPAHHTQTCCAESCGHPQSGDSRQDGPQAASVNEPRCWTKGGPQR